MPTLKLTITWATFCEDKNKHSEALQMYKKAIEMSNGQHIAAYINLASIYLDRNDIFSCIENVESAAKNHTDDCKEALKY